jgi:hypothetical protein
VAAKPWTGIAGHFAVDVSALIWHGLAMARSTNRDARESHHTVSAGILDALGRGFLIATAGVVAGALFDTANLAALSLWMIAVTAAGGVGCMIGSAIVRNAGCDRPETKVDGPMASTQMKQGVATIEAAAGVAPEQGWARRMRVSSKQRERGTFNGRGG